MQVREPKESLTEQKQLTDGPGRVSNSRQAGRRVAPVWQPESLTMQARKVLDGNGGGRRNCKAQGGLARKVRLQQAGVNGWPYRLLTTEYRFQQEWQCRCRGMRDGSTPLLLLQKRARTHRANVYLSAVKGRTGEMSRKY